MRGGPDSALPDAHHPRDLLIRQIQVKAQHQRLTLAVRQPPDRADHFIAFLGAELHRLGGHRRLLIGQDPAPHRPAPQHRTAAIQHRCPDVEHRAIGVLQAVPPPVKTTERLLYDILGTRQIIEHHVSQPDPRPQRSPGTAPRQPPQHLPRHHTAVQPSPEDPQRPRHRRPQRPHSQRRAIRHTAASPHQQIPPILAASTPTGPAQHPPAPPAQSTQNPDAPGQHNRPLAEEASVDLAPAGSDQIQERLDVADGERHAVQAPRVRRDDLRPGGDHLRGVILRQFEPADPGRPGPASSRSRFACHRARRRFPPSFLRSASCLPAPCRVR
jgi:hypothetical protein